MKKKTKKNRVFPLRSIPLDDKEAIRIVKMVKKKITEQKLRSTLEYVTEAVCWRIINDNKIRKRINYIYKNIDEKE